MTVCDKCGKPFALGVQVVKPLTSAYSTTREGARIVPMCLTCFKAAK